MEQYFRQATQMIRRAVPKLLEHFAGPVLAIIVLIPSLQIGLVGDDYRVIDTAHPLSVISILKDLHLGTRGGNLYRPLEPISLRIDYFLWQGSPWGFHFTNILLHASSAWLVSRIALLLSGSWHLAAVAGVLFSLHPTTGAVAGHISARNAGLVCLFLLLSTWLYLKFERTDKRFLLLLSVGAFGMALLSKEQAYLFPAFLLVLAIEPSHLAPDRQTNNLRRIILMSTVLLMTSLLLIINGSEITIPFPASEYGRYGLKLYLAEYGFVLAGFVFLVLLLQLIARRYPRTRVLAWYLAIEAFVIFVGLLPSGRFAQKLDYASWPFSFSYERLAEDLSVLSATLGVIDLTLRDVLIAMAHDYPWVVGSLWLACGILLLIPLALKKSKTKALAGLVWFAIALSPLRVRPVEFFEMNNLYLAVPVVAITIAILTKKTLARSIYLAIPVVVSFTVFWGMNLLDAQANLILMGKFNKELYSLFEKESRATPGPLRVIVNAPDPFRSASRYPELSHWMVFRVVQSAMQLGGYSDENVFFVETRKAQILAVEHGNPCQYEAISRGWEEILLRTLAETLCKSRLSFIDFTAQPNELGRTWIAHRSAQYSGIPLSEAEIYAFDGTILQRLQ